MWKPPRAAPSTRAGDDMSMRCQMSPSRELEPPGCPRYVRPVAERVLVAGAAAGGVVILSFHSGGYFPSEWGLEALPFLLAALAVMLLADSVRLAWPSVIFPVALMALAVWQLLSITWSTGAGVPVLEAEKTFVYAFGAAGLLLILARSQVYLLFIGVVAGITTVAVYALGTRLAPGTLGGAYDPFSQGYQLAAPIGYANALGLLVVLGLVLASGIALHGGPWSRIAAATALVPLASALYFTYSRGAFLALGFGLTVTLGLEHKRLNTVGRLARMAVLPAVGIVLAASLPALTTPGAALKTAQVEGHTLAWQLLALSIAQATFLCVTRVAPTRIHLPLHAGRATGVAACLVVIGSLFLGIGRVGGPLAVVNPTAHVGTTQLPPGAPRPTHHLLSLADDDRAKFWSVALQMIFRHPLLGQGAGSFARTWLQQRSVDHNTLEAHNSYLEVAAELGPVGLGLLLIAVSAPLTALRRRRASSDFVPSAAGAYSAFLLSAAIDWVWDVPLLTLIALSCGVSLLVLARSASSRLLTPVGRVVGISCTAGACLVALVSHVGNNAVADARHALARGEYGSAMSDAARARTWMPWSYEPWQLLGEAQLARGLDRSALASFRQALALDSGDWSLWYDFALADQGRGGDKAFGRAERLNPRGVQDGEPPRVR